jgi:uncharacterized protein with ATP-grasp and redox domains
LFIWPDCIPCILGVSLDAARLAGMDERQVARLVSEVLRAKPLRGENWNITSSEVISDIWVRIQQISGEADPFKAFKAEQNQAALQSYPRAKQLVMKSDDPVLESLKLAIGGNSMDAMRPAREESTGQILDALSRFVIRTQHVEQLKERLRRARHVVYMADNCGEIVFDKLLIEMIRQAYDLHVIFVTRTMPVLNDATSEDALAVGIDAVARIMENGIAKPLPGTMLDKVSPELRTVVEGSDLVISKGGGNHDTLSEEKDLTGRISCLFQAKCYPYCTMHQLPRGALIVHNS